MNKKTARLVAALVLCLSLLVPAFAFADSPTDEILSYQITGNVNDDATVTLYYHLDWKVLVSDGIGPMSWITIGIPNNCFVSYGALSDNIRSIDYVSDYGSNLEIAFTKDYYKDEVCSFDFYVQLDNMYQVDFATEGETAVFFTPGWFDGITVDELIVRWDNTGLSSWSGDCIIENGYNTWVSSLAPGEKVSFRFNYPNDAFGFDTTKTLVQGNETYSGSSSDDGDWFYGLLGFLVFMGFNFVALRAFVRAVKRGYESATGFAAGKTEKKVTRTKVVYYDFCPGCGAPREDGMRTCKYCGRDMVKSEEIIEEETKKEEDKDALKFNQKGEYHYGSDPNTFVRVNVVRVPVRISTPPPSSRGGGRGIGGGHSSGGGRSGGGCAHSSCACACASCACACACACAGGGRAGCSTKDFYKTNLKLHQLELKLGKQKK